MKSLPYAADRNDLRQSCLNTALLFDERVKAGHYANNAERIAALAASEYAYNLAAAIQWVAKNVNGDTADELAAWLDSSLTNGDFDEMNGDLIDCAPNEIALSPTTCGNPYSTQSQGVARCSRGVGHPGIHAGHSDDGTAYQWPNETAEPDGEAS